MAVREELVEGADISAGLLISARVVELQIDTRRQVLDRQAVAEDGREHSSTDIPGTDCRLYWNCPAPSSSNLNYGIQEKFLTELATAGERVGAPLDGCRDFPTLKSNLYALE
jgi:hypothetical protein